MFSTVCNAQSHWSACFGMGSFGDPPPMCNQEPLVVKDNDEDGRPPIGPPVVHSFCICGGDALLEGLLAVSRSKECEILSCLLLS